MQANKADGGNGHGGTPAHATGSLGQRAEGGGLFLSSGAINLSGSTVSENTATGGMGGQGRFAKCSFNSQLHCDGPSGPGGDGGASAGGGLYVLSGTARLFTSTVSGNAANGNSGGGGGGFTAGPTFHFCCQNGGNGGAAQGGGLFLVDGNLTLTQATVSGNSVTAGGGGFGGTGFPPFLGASGGAARGAGIFVSNGNVSAINSTVFGNAANGGKSGSTRFNNHGPAGDAEGGGLYLNHGAVALTGITLASNLTLTPSSLSGMFGVSRGGGIANSGAGLYINSALIGNDNTFIGCVSGCQGKANDGNDVSGPITSSHSLIGETSGATITDEGGNHFNVDPGLDPTGIQFNGGPTETIALLSGSPAINQGDNAICKAPAPTGLAGIDQRGFSRFSDGDGLCDIGAYELNAKLEPTFAGQPGAPNCHGKSVSALTHQHGNLSSAASALGFSSVKALQAAIRAFCGG